MAQKQARDSAAKQSPIPAGAVTRRIITIRSHNVMLDADLAEMYQVPTKRLNEAVKRNRARFPEDFMFQLTEEEAANLRSQFATSSSGYGGRRYMPYVFTQEGVAMLSSVLSSKRAIQVNIAIMRAFVQLRRMAETHQDLAAKIAAMEKKYDAQFAVVFKAIGQLLQPPVTRAIGFLAKPAKK